MFIHSIKNRLIDIHQNGGVSMELYSMMEHIVRGEVDRFMQGEEYRGCRCVRCRADLMALTLNLLPAKYVVTETGEVLSKIEATLPQKQADIWAALLESSQIIMGSPRYKKI